MAELPVVTQVTGAKLGVGAGSPCSKFTAVPPAQHPLTYPTVQRLGPRHFPNVDVAAIANKGTKEAWLQTPAVLVLRQTRRLVGTVRRGTCSV